MTKERWCYMVEVQIWQRNAVVIWLKYKYDKGTLVYMVEVQIWQRTAGVIWLK